MGQCDTLHVALGQLANPPLGIHVDGKALQPAHAPGVGILAVDAVHRQCHVQDFQRRELLVERRRLGYVGDTATRLCLAGRAAVQAHLALIVVDHIEHDLDGGGLAGAIGADEAEHLALAHTEADLA
ncbi:hypothetical protein D3C80_1422360 [compost metagenome]